MVVCDASKPSYDELAALVVAQAEQIAVLRDEDAQLKARIIEFEARVNESELAQFLETTGLGLAVRQVGPEGECV